jgi:hypothetical protein
MTDLYGTDIVGFAQTGSVWSARITANFVAAAATLVGAQFETNVSVGQLKPFLD